MNILLEAVEKSEPKYFKDKDFLISYSSTLYYSSKSQRKMELPLQPNLSKPCSISFLLCDDNSEYKDTSAISTDNGNSPDIFVPNKKKPCLEFTKKESDEVTEIISSIIHSQETCLNKLKDKIMSKMSTVECFFPTVAQKSYGQEKRFISPPPLIQLNCNEKMELFVNMGIKGEKDDIIMLEQNKTLASGNKSYFRYLHTTANMNKTKTFNLNLSIGKNISKLKCNYLLDPIKILSKPSIKISNSSKQNDNIYSGSIISLFNRFNCQTYKTKYLDIENNNFIISTANWSPFIIKLYNQEKIQPINYGSIVVLQSLDLKVNIGPFVIKRIDKGKIIQDFKGLVNPMQKVVFLKADSNLYLTSGDGGVCKNELKYRKVDEGISIQTDICWNITSISSFSCSYQLIKHVDYNITPVPNIIPIITQEKHTQHWIKFKYEYFNFELDEIWFGSYGPVSFSKMDEINGRQVIIMTVPEFFQVKNSFYFIDGLFLAPIFVVRNSSIVYYTNKFLQVSAKGNDSNYMII